jgi:hypothetical protein
MHRHVRSPIEAHQPTVVPCVSHILTHSVVLAHPHGTTPTIPSRSLARAYRQTPAPLPERRGAHAKRRISMMPVSSASTTPPTLSDAHSSLLRLSRRHSLPVSAGLAGLLGLLGNDGTTDTSASGVPSDTASGSGPVPAAARLPARTRSISLAVNGSAGGGDAGRNIGVNRHRYGHRHTRSEAGYNMPVVVRSYRPAPSLPVQERIDEVGLPGGKWREGKPVLTKLCARRKTRWICRCRPLRISRSMAF